MVKGLAHVTFFADDVAEAARWYTEVLGIEPYFVRPLDGPPAYIEFRIGEALDELGLIDRRYDSYPTTTPGGGAIVNWHVDDVDAARERLLALGATEHEPVVHREAGFVDASVLDPFGNVLGLMHSPHYVQMQQR